MHLHLPHLPAALVALSVVYTAAIAVALANPGRPTLAALVVLAGLAWRWVAHHRRASTSAEVVVLTAEAAPAPAPAAAA
jgi:hypothetical protein